MRYKDNVVSNKSYQCQKCRRLLKNSPMGTSGICTECGGSCEVATRLKTSSVAGMESLRGYAEEAIPKGFPPGGALSCTFACYNCGCTQRCNNITTCIRCKSSHFYVKEVHFDGFSISVEPPKPNSCMRGDSMILVPDKDTFEALKDAMWATGKAYVRSRHPLGHPITRSQWDEVLFYGRKGMWLWTADWRDYLTYLRGLNLPLEQLVTMILEQHPKWEYLSIPALAKDCRHHTSEEVIAVVKKLCEEGVVIQSDHHSDWYGIVDRVRKPYKPDKMVHRLQSPPSCGSFDMTPKVEAPAPTPNWLRRALNWLFKEQS